MWGSCTSSTTPSRSSTPATPSTPWRCDELSWRAALAWLRWPGGKACILLPCHLWLGEQCQIPLVTYLTHTNKMGRACTYQCHSPQLKILKEYGVSSQFIQMIMKHLSQCTMPCTPDCCCCHTGQPAASQRPLVITPQPPSPTPHTRCLPAPGASPPPCGAPALPCRSGAPA